MKVAKTSRSFQVGVTDSESGSLGTEDSLTHASTVQQLDLAGLIVKHHAPPYYSIRRSYTFGECANDERNAVSELKTGAGDGARIRNFQLGD